VSEQPAPSRWRIVPYEGHSAFKKVRIADDARALQIARHLMADECVALLGPPLNEKSRLLKDAAALVAENGRYYTLYVDLWRARSTDETTFFASLAGLVRDGLGPRLDGDGNPDPQEVGSPRAFQNYLAACSQRLDRNVALLVDHLQALPPDLVHSLMVALRAAYMEREADAPNQMVTVVTGGMNLVGLSTGPTSPFNIAKPVVAAAPDHEQSLALAQATFAALGRRVSQGALDLLVEWAVGERHLVPWLCHEAAGRAGERSGVTRPAMERSLAGMWQAERALAPIREAIRMIEEDPDTLLDVLHVLEHGSLPRSRSRQGITRTGTDRLQLSGALLLADGQYVIKNRIHREALQRSFTTERVGHILRIAGRWREAIDHLAPRLSASPDPEARPQLLEATVQSIYAADSFERAVDLLAQGLQTGFGLSDVGVYQARPAHGTLELVYPRGENELAPRIALADPVAVEARAYHYGSYALRGSRDEARLVAVLARENRPLGVVTVEGYLRGRPAHETPDDLPELLRFLSHAAGAIENVLVRAAYRTIGQAVLNTAALGATLARVLEAVAEALGCDHAALHLVDPAGEQLENAAGLGLAWSQEWRRLARTRLGSGHPAAACLEEGRTLIARGSDERLDRAFVERFGLQDQTMAFLPLRAAGEQLGALELGYAGGLRLALTEGNRRVLDGFADQVAIAVYNLRLLQRSDEALARRVAELEKLRSSSLAVSSTLDLDDVLSLILRDVQALFPGTEATVWEYRAAEDTLVVLQSSLLDMAYRNCRLGMGCVAGQAVAGRETRFAPELSPAAGDVDWDPAALLGMRSMVAVPLLSHNRAVGAIGLYAREPGDPAAEGARLLEAFAAQAALAIENARLYREEIRRQRLDEELNVGRAIQRSMLPKAPPVATGWDFAAAYRAARTVGGDFYDFCELPAPARIGIVIADVAGKGVPAALFMALSRTVIRTTALSGRSPASALMRANEIILKDSASDLFLTAAFGVVDIGTGRMIYANAGHNRPLRFRAATGAVEELLARGTLLGVFETIALDEERVDIGPGDVLVFYTDGVTEALDPEGEMFGELRLAQAIERSASGSSQEIWQEISDTLDDFTAGAEQADDLACVVVKRARE
jgi:sigma-B regulation protein RsbU (phosphoserine phosphatase)